MSELLELSETLNDYTQEIWSPETEEEFRSWMIDYLKRNAEARKEMMKIPRKDYVEKTVNWFIFDLCPICDLIETSPKNTTF